MDRYATLTRTLGENMTINIALARRNNILLLWVNIFGFRVPSVFLVSFSRGRHILAYHFYFYFSMRYSRHLEESSFANRKADYFWLLLLSSIMLLVCSSLFILLLLNPFRRLALYLIFHSCHPPSRLCPYICGRDVIRLRRFHFSD
jgi:hypothetical protein